MVVNNFDVLKKMCADNLDIRLGTDMLGAKRTRRGTQITFGVAGNVITGMVTGKSSACVLIWDKEQFDKVKKELEQ